MTINLKAFTILNKYRRHIPPLIDACIAALSYVLPFAIKGLEPIKTQIITRTIQIYILIYVGTLFALRVYKNMWRYTGLVELYHCLGASILANLLFFSIIKEFHINVFSYVFSLATAVSALLSVTAMVVFRAVFVIVRNIHNKQSNDKINVMIVGSGQATLIMGNYLLSKYVHKYNTSKYVR